MSKLLIIEIAMEKADPELHEIYFGNNALIHYQEPPVYIDETDVPFIVIGMKDNMSKQAAAEFLANCPAFKTFHRKLLGKEVKSYVTDEEKFKQVNDWYSYFHPNGKYR